LQSVNLPTGFTGDLVLELRLRNGRVERVLLDDQESTIEAAEVVDPVRRSLQTWTSPSQQTGTVRLTLRL
jgi:Ca-activated chloride channel homolog